ncbi:MAG TPA: pantoate--beta-alanine ligase [Chthoniobacteraceae bacterium]|nr:pantoate--beta-alanine ligase [Chthoniobacteraceae bacterium]
MKVLRKIAAVRRIVRVVSGPVVLVPTMGALHDGHAALIDRARQVAGQRGFVVVSIFVNPTQFGPQEGFSKYPRTLRDDRKVCELHGADLVFCPTHSEMYPADFSTWVNEEAVSAPLCGGSRPGHFRGVCTVVLKLFTIVEPSAAVFGLKDFQQYMVIRRMVRDLNLPVRVLPMPTVRETDGLALSSRNRFLTPKERAQAPVLRGALLEARAAFRRGETRVSALRAILLEVLSTAPLARLDYVEIRDADTLAEVATVRRNCVMALAVFFGRTRLIDNLWLR